MNQNPQVALMYECDIWNFPRPMLKYRFRRNWAERLEFFNQALSRHRLAPAAQVSGLGEIRTPLDLYRAYGARKGAAVYGEKSPFCCDQLLQLHGEYPGAAFVFVWRNPVEVYRRVLRAGETSRFFGKPGMLSRMIYLQEQAIRQILTLEKQGARLFHVDYSSLVDDTERVCRDISRFLGVPYDPQMLQLDKADLFSIYTAPHHAYLRRGIIERQEYKTDLVPSSTVRKLERYRFRWESMQSQWLKPNPGANPTPPGMIELIYHNCAGWLLSSYDSLIRAGFEFLPMSWLLVYRLSKNWVVNPPSGAVDERTSIFKELKIHWVTILTGCAMIALIASIQLRSSPYLMFQLFYAIPCVFITLVTNTRWGTLFVLFVSAITPVFQYGADTDYQSTFVLVWNFLTRFLLLEMFILTIGRIRLELALVSHHVK
jgi:hypothetical protein